MTKTRFTASSPFGMGVERIAHPNISLPMADRVAKFQYWKKKREEKAKAKELAKAKALAEGKEWVEYGPRKFKKKSHLAAHIQISTKLRELNRKKAIAKTQEPKISRVVPTKKEIRNYCRQDDEFRHMDDVHKAIMTDIKNGLPGTGLCSITTKRAQRKAILLKTLPFGPIPIEEN